MPDCRVPHHLDSSAQILDLIFLGTPRFSSRICNDFTKRGGLPPFYPPPPPIPSVPDLERMLNPSPTVRVTAPALLCLRLQRATWKVRCKERAGLKPGTTQGEKSAGRIAYAAEARATFGMPP